MFLVNQRQIMMAGDKENLKRELAASIVKFAEKMQQATKKSFDESVEEIIDAVFVVHRYIKDDDISEYVFQGKETKEMKKAVKKRKKKKKEERKSKKEEKAQRIQNDPDK